MEEQFGINNDTPSNRVLGKPKLIAKPKLMAKQIINAIPLSESGSTVISIRKFWTNTSGAYKIDPESLHQFLNERGYKSYKPSGVKTTILVKVENNRVREVSTIEIWNLCWEYIDNEYQFIDLDERKQVKDIFHRSKPLFHKQNLSLLKTVNLNECKDTKDKTYLFFNDCVLELNAHFIMVKDYKEIEGIVFESDICDFNLKSKLGDSKVLLNLEPEGEFYEFLQDLCKNSNKVVSEKSLESLVSIIGYLVHRYKDSANAKAIIFMDTYRDGSPNGGTGKGLLTKGIGKVRESVFQDGKFFSSGDKFTFANVNYGTRLLIIDDVSKTFDFEKIFPLITEKLVVERKYENKFVIPFEESPKVILTTNYTIEGTSGSHKRRKVEFILSETFDADYSPEDKFGHLLFIEWSDEEWRRFYLLMAYCVQEFLRKGLVMPTFNVAIRKLKMEATSQFIEFAQGIEVGVKINKKVKYDEFYSKYPNHYKIELTTFRNWLKYLADAFGYTFKESHSGSDNFFEYSLE
jgi:hypothetical protein